MWPVTHEPAPCRLVDALDEGLKQDRGVGVGPAEASSASRRSINSTEDLNLLIDVATRFYLQGESQVNIARALGINASTISRYLKRARDSGLIQLRITAPQPLNMDLGRELANHFGLSRVVVANATDGGKALAAAAADYIDGVLFNGMRVATSWGGTLLSVVSSLRPGTVSGLELAQLNGGTGYAAPGIQAQEILRLLAGLYPGTNTHYLHAPLIVGSPEIRELFSRERSISPALQAAASCELALLGIGTLGEEASLVRYGHLEPTDRASLIVNGAVGDICGRFFRADGRVALESLDRRTIAIEWEELKAISTVVAVAAGRNKCDAIRGALRTGCLNVLITDEPTAALILAAETHQFDKSSAESDPSPQPGSRKRRRTGKQTA
jgi:DNA-binding transcriptional regulator LsrR (DeoR family)